LKSKEAKKGVEPHGGELLFDRGKKDLIQGDEGWGLVDEGGEEKKKKRRAQTGRRIPCIIEKKKPSRTRTKVKKTPRNRRKNKRTDWMPGGARNGRRPSDLRRGKKKLFRYGLMREEEVPLPYRGRKKREEQPDRRSKRASFFALLGEGLSPGGQILKRTKND